MLRVGKALLACVISITLIHWTSTSIHAIWNHQAAAGVNSVFHDIKISASADDERSRLKAYSFDQFANDHRKSYATNEEYERRSAIFYANLDTILHHNAQPNRHFTLGVNAFADMTDSELPTGYDKSQSYKYRRSIRSSPESHLLGAASSLGETKPAPADITSSFRMDLPDDIVRQMQQPLPPSVDWRTHPGVTGPVKNQGACGSCWAFASTAALESHIAIKTGVLFTLSVQEFVSCAPNPHHCGGTGGCAGSTAELAFSFAIQHGITEEWSFGYASGQGAAVQCSILDRPKLGDADEHHVANSAEELSTEVNRSPVRVHRGSSAARRRHLVGDRTSNISNDPSNRTFVDNAVASIESFANLPGNSYDSLMAVVAHIGPVVVNVAAAGWSLYSGGVFDDEQVTNRDINHVVVLEGYGTDEDSGLDYWLVRNSYGPTWGEKGYIRLKRVDPATLEDPESDCRMDVTPAEGISCTIDGGGKTVQPNPVKVCGTSGILYDGVVPLGGHLI